MNAGKKQLYLYVIYNFDEPCHVRIVKAEPYHAQMQRDNLDASGMDYTCRRMMPEEVKGCVDELKEKYDVSVDDRTGEFYNAVEELLEAYELLVSPVWARYLPNGVYRE